MGKEFLYKFEGKIYTWKELMQKFYKEYMEEQKKEKWWKRDTINIFDFALGFSKGALYGVKLIAEKEDYELIDNSQKSGNK